MKDFNQQAKEIRGLVVKMLTEAGSGHTAGPLGSVDFWTALYLGGVINYRVEDPRWEGRDRVVVSAGHYAPAVYATLAKAGFFKEKELMSLRKLGSRLQGHLYFKVGGKNNVPGIETSSGPLGQGISQAVGMALVGKMERKSWQVYCFCSDGEQEEGQTWEGYMLAGKYGLSNLTFVMDRNGIQIDGETREVMPLEPLRLKLESFGLAVEEVDGHNIEEILESLRKLKMVTDKPGMLILRTVPGKGVSWLEGDYRWHGRVMSKEESEKAIKEIKGEEEEK